MEVNSVIRGMTMSRINIPLPVSLINIAKFMKNVATRSLNLT